ncbi:luciferin 4-monooxygenase-like [Aphomia sociella]
MANILRRTNDSVHWFINELTSRIVAESGNPNDRFHLGKIMLQSFKDDPDFVMQIDGGTGESITYKDTLEKTVRCAIAMKKVGLKTGDVIVIMGPNHVNISIPFYAGFYIGVIVAPVDLSLSVAELQDTFSVDTPKIVFCQNDKANDIKKAVEALNLDTKIITFDKGNGCSFSEFLEEYYDETKIDDFKPSNFDPAETIALLISTSGTTGLPKAAAITHKSLSITNPYWWIRCHKFPTPTRLELVCSPIQWLAAIGNFMISPVVRYTRLQTSHPLTQEHMCYLINKYRPSHMIISPTFATSIIKHGDRDKCDLTCFEMIHIGGIAVPLDLLNEIKTMTPGTELQNTYGLSEATIPVFIPNNSDGIPMGSSGNPINILQYRLINVETQEDILEPNTPGELWLKGPGLFKEYYRNPQATADAYTEDRWFRTGDIFYRDENWNFFFVERIKLLLKYKGFQISPVEVEGVIRRHPGVLDVAVTSIPDQECGDLPVACVVPRQGSVVTPQEIKDLVKDTLSDAKQLRGGVILLKEMPVMASTKVDRRKLKKMALTLEKK